jgi:predicted dehydrogenase
MTTFLALVGGAHIHTPGFIERLNIRSDVAVKYVWDHDPARAQKRAESLNSKSTTDLNIIWNDTSIQGVIICSETYRHEPLVLAAVGAGKHIFAEKPLGLGATDSYHMAEAIERAGVLFQTGYFYSFMLQKSREPMANPPGRTCLLPGHMPSSYFWMQSQGKIILHSLLRKRRHTAAQ